MAEAAENDGGGGETAGEWRNLVSSPNSGLFAGFLSEGFASSNGGGDQGGGGGEGDVFGLEAMIESCSNWNPPIGRNGGGGGGGSIAERRAANGKGEFHAPRLNTARFRATSPLSSPSVRSPYLTIPPGLSPTSLLDSPVLLSNSQALPSPTTGTFSLLSQCLEATPISISASADIDKDKVGNVDSSFMFKPNPTSFQCVSGTEDQVSSASDQIQNVKMADNDHQVLTPVQTQVNFESQAGLPMKSYADASAATVEGATDMIVAPNCVPLQTSNPSAASELNQQPEEPVQDSRLQQLPDGEKRGGSYPYPPAATGRPSEDGYNWRKYGQKQVKGSEYPRSYYKCTHQNCQVKKKIERSHDGQITEIIYKGGHNHPQPQPSRRSAIGSPYSLSELEMGEDSGSYVKVEGGSAWRGIPQGLLDNKVSSDWRLDGQERTPSTSVVTDTSDPLSTSQGKQLSTIESADTPELSSTLASHDDEDRATQGSISLGDDADGDESESKRRKKDTCLIETSMASRAVREPRVVVQTDSEVDILDDGYRWRKYGQKVVKGNPNPRSYYKCTSAGCSVRKHVERASHDLKYVITTYEGKHNHEVPAARSSSHLNSTGGSVPPAASGAQASLSLPRNTNSSKPETQVQDLVPRFGRKPDFSNEYFRSNNLGGFPGEMKFVPPSCYVPPYPASLPCGNIGLNATHTGTHQPSHMPQVITDFPISIPMNVPLPVNLAMGGFGCNNLGKAVGTQSFLVGQQQIKEGDMRFLRPKQEQKDDAIFESQLPNYQLPNASVSMYQQMIGGYRP